MKFKLCLAFALCFGYLLMGFIVCFTMSFETGLAFALFTWLLLIGFILLLYLDHLYVNKKKIVNNKDVKESENLQNYNFEEMEKNEKVRKLVEEWEGFDLCVPGDWASSAADRCQKFEHDCHKCLLEYAYTHQDLSLISEDLEILGKELDEKDFDSNISICLEKLNC